MKTSTLLLIVILFSFKIIGQTIPVLTESDLIHKEDLKKKSGWIIIKVDSAFREAADDASAKYEYYEFCNHKGQYNLSFSKKLGFPKKTSKIIYKKTDPSDKSKILNGIVDFYDKNNHMSEKYVFKNGFYIKVYEYTHGILKSKYNGKINGVVEYSPGKNSVESWGNYFNDDGKWISDSHELNDGTQYTSLPIRNKKISLNEMYIGNVWHPGENEQYYHYEMGIDTIAHNGKKAATIKSIDENIKGSGLLRQDCKADKFLGKRIRMSGYLKSENVAEGAGLWIRVDQAGSDGYLSFDNMKGREIKGTTDWKKYEIVIDVSTNASIIKFGAIIHGTGQIWFDDIAFEVVDKSVSLTGTGSISDFSNMIQSEPENLDFEK